jgi:hypothetical protein
MVRRTSRSAWDRAAECAILAEEAATARAVSFYYKLMDSWIQVANNLETIERFERFEREVLTGKVLPFSGTPETR